MKYIHRFQANHNSYDKYFYHFGFRLANLRARVPRPRSLRIACKSANFFFAYLPTAIRANELSVAEKQLTFLHLHPLQAPLLSCASVLHELDFACDRHLGMVWLHQQPFQSA